MMIKIIIFFVTHVTCIHKSDGCGDTVKGMRRMYKYDQLNGNGRFKVVNCG